MLGLGATVDFVLSAVSSFVVRFGGSVLVKVLSSLGIGLAFGEFGISSIGDALVGYFGALPPEIAYVISEAGVDQALGIILAAVGIRAATSFSLIRLGAGS